LSQKGQTVPRVRVKVFLK